MKQLKKPKLFESAETDSINNPKLIGINYNGSSGLSNISSVSNKIILDHFEELPDINKQKIGQKRQGRIQNEEMNKEYSIF